LATVLLEGVGAVGIRAARQLVDTPGLDRLLITARGSSHAADLAASLGDRAEAVELFPDDPLTAGVGAAAAALPAALVAPRAKRALAAGVPFTSTVDDAAAIDELLELDEPARRAGVLLAPGCGLAPGLADALARHAADALDSVDEIHVARAGSAGPACTAAVRRSRRDPAVEWRDGGWRDERRPNPELVWFPDPIGSRECAPVAVGVALLVRAFPGVRRVTVRFAEPVSRRLTWPGRRGLDEGWGSTRVEVWGWRGRARESMVYGLIDRTGLAAGTVLAVTAAGVHGLAALVEPVPFLAELARRGVKAAVFEGVAVA
jgi:saccharopine dehydrogenase-like NADP-dependent oxidoreductase